MVERRSHWSLQKRPSKEPKRIAQTGFRVSVSVSEIQKQAFTTLFRFGAKKTVTNLGLLYVFCPGGAGVGVG